MSGRVMVRFVVAPNGTVGAAIVQDSTLGDNDVEHCITDTVKTWTFPKPTGGGLVVVSYPFVLKQAERPPSSP
jgi:TonB family protein